MRKAVVLQLQLLWETRFAEDGSTDRKWSRDRFWLVKGGGIYQSQLTMLIFIHDIHDLLTSPHPITTTPSPF
jgi:hypothetical protein